MTTTTLLLLFISVLVIVPLALQLSRIFEGFEAKKPNGVDCMLGNECQSGKCEMFQGRRQCRG